MNYSVYHSNIMYNSFVSRHSTRHVTTYVARCTCNIPIDHSKKQCVDHDVAKDEILVVVLHSWVLRLCSSLVRIKPVQVEIPDQRHHGQY